MSDDNAISKLTAAGIAIGVVGPQRAALAELSSAEVDALISVKSRLDAIVPDVEGHLEPAGGIFH